MLGVPGTRVIEIEALEETVSQCNETENGNPKNTYEHDKERNVLHFILCRSWEF